MNSATVARASERLSGLREQGGEFQSHLRLGTLSKEQRYVAQPLGFFPARALRLTFTLDPNFHDTALLRARVHPATAAVALVRLLVVSCLGTTMASVPFAAHAAGPIADRCTGTYWETPAGRLVEIKGPLKAKGTGPFESREEEGGDDVPQTGFAVLGAEGGTLEAGDPGTAHYAPAFGERKVAVLLVNFLDSSGEPGTVDQARTAFGTINDYFVETSYSQVSLTTDVFGWWTLPYDSARCSDPALYPVSGEILEEAARRGVDLGPYDHLVYVFNEPLGIWCSSGAGTVSPRSQGKVWRTWNDASGTAEGAFDGVEGIETTVHELGHNLGLWHANRLNCGADVLGESCSLVGYGDFYDAMGSSAVAPHFNAFHKERLGWVTPDVSGWNRITTAVASGLYHISPYAADGGEKSLRIRRGAGPDGGVDYFYLEFRQPLGWDEGLRSHAYEGLLVHLGNDTVADSSRLLDMNPADSWEHVLRPGQPFYDPASDVTIELISADVSGALVDVTIGTDLTPPAVDLASPLDGAALEKGSTTTLVARATDETAMARVEFYVDGALQCTDYAPAFGGSDYECPYTVPKGRSRTLTVGARAVDSRGNSASASVQVSTTDGAGKRGGK